MITAVTVKSLQAPSLFSSHAGTNNAAEALSPLDDVVCDTIMLVEEVMFLSKWGNTSNCLQVPLPSFFWVL